MFWNAFILLWFLPYVNIDKPRLADKLVRIYSTFVQSNILRFPEGITPVRRKKKRNIKRINICFILLKEDKSKIIYKNFIYDRYSLYQIIWNHIYIARDYL